MGTQEEDTVIPPRPLLRCKPHVNAAFRTLSSLCPAQCERHKSGAFSGTKFRQYVRIMLHLCCALMVHSVCTARNWRCISKWRCRSFQQRFYWVSISWAGGVRKNSTLDSWNPVTLDLCKSGSSLETLPRICKFLQIVDNPQFFCVATIRTSIHPKLT